MIMYSTLATVWLSKSIDRKFSDGPIARLEWGQ
jgi:hypothetical protein